MHGSSHYISDLSEIRNCAGAEANSGPPSRPQFSEKKKKMYENIITADDHRFVNYLFMSDTRLDILRA